MRSLQPQTSFGLYNFIVTTSKRVLFLPSSGAYVRSFLYLLYTLIKLYSTKALSDQASSLAPDWILLLRGPRIPVSSRDSTTTFHLGGSSGILQDKVRMLGALVLCSLSEHVFCCALTNSTVCLYEWMACPAWSKQGALLCGSMVISYGLWQKPVGVLYRPANAKRHPISPSGTDQKWAKWVDRTLLSRSNFSVSLTIS